MFIDRMAKSVEVEAEAPFMAEDLADTANGERDAYDAAAASDPDTVVYRISGAFFFGAASTVGSVLDRIADQPKTFILDCSGIPLVDSTGANVLEGVAHKAARQGVLFYIAGASPQMRKLLTAHGVRPPLVHYRATVASAKAHARAQVRQSQPEAEPA
jgi:SulP family sulfate permease